MTFKGKIPWNKNKPWPEDIKKKISESHKGRPKPWNSHPPSEATKIKLSEARKGKPNPLNSHPLSEATKKKLSIAVTKWYAKRKKLAKT